MDHLRAAIVDDDDETLDLIQQILKEEDIHTRRYSRAESLLADLRKADFDLIITDLMLPGMTGLDLLNDLNRRGVEIPVVIITGYASLDSAIEAVNRGAFSYIKKPFTIEEIRFAISRLRQRNETMKTMQTLKDQVRLLKERIDRELREKLEVLDQAPPFDLPREGRHAGRAFAAIEYLGKLKSDGLISDKEFGEYKGKILRRVV